MTEREHSLPQETDNPKYPEGLEFLTDSILMAEAKRDLYESQFIYQMAKGPGYQDELFTPLEGKAYVDGRITSIKLALTSSFDTQKIIDSLDLNVLTEGMAVDVFDFDGTYQKTVPFEEDQAENFVRTTANIISDVRNVDEEKNIKFLVKRFVEAKKIAYENNVPIETVFNDQTLYFELNRKSISPEEIIASNKQMLESVRQVLVPLEKHDIRTSTIIANADDKSLSIDDIDDVVVSLMDDPTFKQEDAEGFLETVRYFGRVSYATIERYWGEKTAQFFT